MQAFLEFVVRNLVDYPDEVIVSMRSMPGKTAYDLRVHRSDVGKLVGKNGQTIDAIRALVAVAGAKVGQRFQIEIVEESRRPTASAPAAAEEVLPASGSEDPKLSSLKSEEPSPKQDAV